MAWTRRGRMRRYWRTVEIRRLREIYQDMGNEQIGALLGRTWSAVQNLAVKLGLHKSAAFMASPACRWPKGHKPWNAGRKGWQAGGRAELTKFKKGHKGARTRRAGSERMTRDGIEVKVAHPNVWVSKARVVWEKHRGPIPEGAIVRLMDGNWWNCKPDNLLLITRAEHARLNYRPRKPKPIPAWLM